MARKYVSKSTYKIGDLVRFNGGYRSGGNSILMSIATGHTGEVIKGGSIEILVQFTVNNGLGNPVKFTARMYHTEIELVFSA